MDQCISCIVWSGKWKWVSGLCHVCIQCRLLSVVVESSHVAVVREEWSRLLFQSAHWLSCHIEAMHQSPVNSIGNYPKVNASGIARYNVPISPLLFAARNPRFKFGWVLLIWRSKEGPNAAITYKERKNEKVAEAPKMSLLTASPYAWRPISACHVRVCTWGYICKHSSLHGHFCLQLPQLLLFVVFLDPLWRLGIRIGRLW